MASHHAPKSVSRVCGSPRRLIKSKDIATVMSSGSKPHVNENTTKSAGTLFNLRRYLACLVDSQAE
tara:strand:- start:414 stop:611 length:198 start_codon:yes stop_codon:yes gene_type:complete